jgi:hypothetical protein
MPTDPALNKPDSTPHPSVSDDTTLNKSGSAARSSVPDDTVLNNESVVEMRHEIERLHAELARANADAERYRQAAYTLLNERVPYAPPTEEELRDLLHGTRGQPLTDVIAELEREGDG